MHTHTHHSCTLHHIAPGCKWSTAGRWGDIRLVSVCLVSAPLACHRVSKGVITLLDTLQKAVSQGDWLRHSGLTKRGRVLASKDAQHLSARVSLTPPVLLLDLSAPAPVAQGHGLETIAKNKDVCMWYYEVRQKGRVDLMGVKGSCRHLPPDSWCWPGLWRVARPRVDLMFSLDGARGSLNRPFWAFVDVCLLVTRWAFAMIAMIIWWNKYCVWMRHPHSVFPHCALPHCRVGLFWIPGSKMSFPPLLPKMPALEKEFNYCSPPFCSYPHFFSCVCTGISQARGKIIIPLYFQKTNECQALLLMHTGNSMRQKGLDLERRPFS